MLHAIDKFYTAANRIKKAPPVAKQAALMKVG
jgi:hypothetical protein